MAYGTFKSNPLYTEIGYQILTNKYLSKNEAFITFLVALLIVMQRSFALRCGKKKNI